MDKRAQRLIDHAALSGAFAPSRFLYHRDKPDAAEQARRDRRALATLAPLCDEVVQDDQILWRMHNADRVRALRALMARPDDMGRLWRKRGPLKHDIFARVLRACLTHDLPLTGALPAANNDNRAVTDALREAIAAASFAAGVLSGPAQVSARSFERTLRIRSITQAEDARRKLILPDGLFGRVAERAAVLQFLQGGAAMAPIRELDTPDPHPVRSLLLTGSPGMGKSAFLTDLVTHIAALPMRPWLIHFDFDQMTLAHGGPIAWSEEVTRQIGHQAPDLAPDLSQMRARHAQMRRDTDHDSARSFADMMLDDMRQILTQQPGAANRPLVVLLDTVEEITAQDNRDLFVRDPTATLFHRLIAWVGRLTMIASSDLSLICSGRTGPPTEPGGAARWFDAHLDLPELDDSAATELLGRFAPDLTQPQRAALGVTLGGHPLILLLVSKHLRSLNPSERRALITELDTDGLRSRDAEDMIRTLYSRFLGRMRVPDLPDGMTDDDIRALAHPGLLLREVSIETLRDVIAPAVGVDLTPQGWAQIAFDALREQVWLVDSAPGGTQIRHRADVRRVMLPMMLASSDPAIRQVLDRAIAHHDAADRQIEAGYLRLLQGQTAFLRDRPDLAAGIRAYVGAEEIERLDSGARAMLKAQIADGDALSDAELRTLPKDLQFSARLAAESQSIKQTGARSGFGPLHSGLVQDKFVGDPFENLSIENLDALGAPPKSGAARDATIVMRDPQLHDRIAIAFVEADFAAVSRIGWEVLGNLPNWPDIGRPLRFDVPFHESWLWRLTLAGHVAVPPDLGDIPLLQAIAEQDYDAALKGTQIYSPDALFFDLDMLCSGLGPRQTQFDPTDGLLGVERYSDVVVNLRMLRMLGQSSLFRHAVRGASGPTRVELSSASHPYLSRQFRDLSRDSINPASDDTGTVTLLDDGKSSGPKRDLIRALVAVNQATEPDQTTSLFEMYRTANLGDGGLVAAFVPAGGHSDGVADLLTRGQSPELHETIAAAILSEADTDAVVAALQQVAGRATLWPTYAHEMIATLQKTGTNRRDLYDIVLELVRMSDLCGQLPSLVRKLGDTGTSARWPDLVRIFNALDRRWTWPT